MKLAVSNLTIERGYRRVIEDFNLIASAGDLVHIRGRNGSGKSSVLRTISGLLPLYEGSIKWCGEPIESIDSYANCVNYIGHASGLSPELTGRENLIFYKNLSASKEPAMDISDALLMCDATDLNSKYVKYLSAGERQKLVVARLLLFSCPLWLLDEPFNSLDTVIQRVLERIIDKHVLGGGIVLMTSHQPFESQQPVNTAILGAD